MLVIHTHLLRGLLLVGVVCVLASQLWAQDEARAEKVGMTAEELFAAGQEAYAAGDFAKADALFSKMVEDFGESAELQAQIEALKPFLAITKVRVKKFDEAREMIDEALKLPKLDPALGEELSFWDGICKMKAGDYIECQHAFGGFFQNEKNDKARRFEALLLFATADILQGDFEKGAKFLESQMPKLRKEMPEAAGRAAVLLLHALVEGGLTDQGLRYLKEQYPRMGEMTQLVSFQSLALKLGARFLEEGKWHEAIACMQRIWSRERLLDHQSRRLDELKGRLSSLRLRKAKQDAIFHVESMVKRIEREVANFSKLENFDASLRLRLATAFQGLERYREAALILEAMLDEMEPTPVVEQANVRLVQCWMQMERWPKAIEAADAYVERFAPDPESVTESLPVVRFLKGEALRGNGEPKAASVIFHRMVEAFPGTDYEPRARFLAGICELEADEILTGIATFRELAKKHPKSPLVEDAFFWEGMGYSFQKEHQKCRDHLEAYLKKYAKGRYVVDATFRRTFCSHSMAYYRTAISEFQGFLKKHADSHFADEARLLLGDAFLTTGEIDQGIEMYAKISPKSRRFFEDGYFKAGKALRLTERHGELRTHFDKFIEKHPQSPKVTEAVYWIGWSHRAEGNEAKAREIYWDTIEKHGDDPELVAVEDIYAALPKLYSNDFGGLLQKLDEVNREARKAKQLTQEVRSLWARGNLLKRSDAKSAASSFRAAGLKADVKLHSPRILADAGDAFLVAGEEALAEKLFLGLRKWNPRAVEKDRAYFGLGQIAESQGKPDEALDYYGRFQRDGVSPMLVGRVLLRKAKLETEGGKKDAARDTLDALLGNKFIPNREKAAALMEYGFWWRANEDPLKATAYFERVYVAYGKYRDLVASAYLERGRSLETLQKNTEAVETYRELVGREDLAEFGEVVAQAQKRLEALGG